MARSVETILLELDAKQAAETGLSGLNSTSQTAIYRLWKYITALVINLHEQLWDLFKSDLEEIVATAPVGSDRWLQAKVLEFQYDSVTPQVVELVDFVPTYQTVDETKRIITRCAVKTQANRIISVKVAKSEPPVALASGELSSLQGYLTNTGSSSTNGKGIGFAGTQILAQSLTSDKLYFKASITYDGQYTSVIQTNVEAAIGQYMSNIPFDGIFYIIQLIDYIQAVPGVNDVFIEELALRANSVAFANRTKLINNFTTVYTTLPLYAGYVVEETTVGNLFADSITYNAV